MRFIWFIIFICAIILNFSYAEGTLSFNLGGSYNADEPETVKPDAGLLAGWNLFHTFTEYVSFFSSLGGFLDYRYLDAEWRYLYDCALDLSIRGDTFLVKPSILLKGEQYYSDEFSLPHVWENSGELYFSYDIKASSVFLSPCFSWEDDSFFIKGKTGFTFSFLTRYVMSIAFSTGKTVLESENDELYFYPEAILSIYPDKPCTLTLSFAYTWYDSDYETGAGDAPELLPIFDFMSFFTDVEYSVIISEKISCTIYMPFTLIFKRHNAVEDGDILDEDEWIFSTGVQVDFGIDFAESHRCVASLSGEKAFSNSTYQETAECVLSVAYEFLF